jgi:hypothetical protein
VPIPDQRPIVTSLPHTGRVEGTCCTLHAGLGPALVKSLRSRINARFGIRQSSRVVPRAPPVQPFGSKLHFGGPVNTYGRSVSRIVIGLDWICPHTLPRTCNPE